MGCLKCGGPLPSFAVQHNDLFCSTECAKAYHGVVMPSSATPTKQPDEALAACSKCGGPRTRQPSGRVVCPSCKKEWNRKYRKKRAKEKVAA